MLRHQTARRPVMGSAGRKKTLWLLTMVAPGAIWLILIRYLPMFGIVMAFLDYRLPTRKMPFPINLLHSDWVGLDNFQFLFTSDALTMIRNTLGYNIVWIALGLVLAVALAIMMSELTKKFLAKTYQTLMFFPYFLSWVVAAYFLFAFLDPTNGMIVRAQKAAGVTPIDWYNEPKYWPVILTICSMWKNTGYSTVLYLSAITGIDRSQYEAAAVLGYSKMQTFMRIILPQVVKHILPSITNEVITLVKDTSFAFTLAYQEMFSIGKQIANSQTSFMPFVIAGVFYYVFNMLVAFLMNRYLHGSLFALGLSTPCSTVVQILLCGGYFLFLRRKETTQ